MRWCRRSDAHRGAGMAMVPAGDSAWRCPRAGAATLRCQCAVLRWCQRAMLRCWRATPGPVCKARGRHAMLGVTARCSVPACSAPCLGAMLGAGVRCSVPACKAWCRRVTLGASVHSLVPACSAQCRCAMLGAGVRCLVLAQRCSSAGGSFGTRPLPPSPPRHGEIEALEAAGRVPPRWGWGRGHGGGSVGGALGAALRSPSLSSSFSPSFF